MGLKPLPLFPGQSGIMSADLLLCSVDQPIEVYPVFDEPHKAINLHDVLNAFRINLTKLDKGVIAQFQ